MSGDFDPRDLDTCKRDDGIHDRKEELLVIGRGPGSASLREDSMVDDTRARNEDWRDERDREPREREADGGSIEPRDVFMRDLHLPRGPERELVHDRDCDYTLNGSESRTLSTVGAFRVVSERDLRDSRDDASILAIWKIKDSFNEFRSTAKTARSPSPSAGAACWNTIATAIQMAARRSTPALTRRANEPMTRNSIVRI